METIDVHSKSFVVKWIQIPDNSSIIFQLKPIKRSINLAIYKSQNDSLSNGSNGSPNPTFIDNIDSKSSSSTSLHRKRSNSTLSLSLEDRLKISNLTEVKNFGQLNGNETFKYNLKFDKGGIFAFVFDNTFSKSYSKKVLFNKFFVSDDKVNYSISPASSSTNLLHPAKGQFLQGYLLKKKRKKLQGFTKRFFILNFKYNTLSYYLNENSLKIRGEMQINISTVTAFKDENTIVIDSGMEIWILKTLNKEDWDNWINALNFIKLGSTNNQNDSSSNEHNNHHHEDGIATHENSTRELLAESPLSSATDSPKLISKHQIDEDTTIQPLDHHDIGVDTPSDDHAISTIYENLNDINDHFDSQIPSTNKRKLLELTSYVKSLLPNLKPSAHSIFSQDYFDASDEPHNQTLDDHVLLLQGRHNSSISVDDLSDDDDFTFPKVAKIEEQDESNTRDKHDGYVEDLYPLPVEKQIKRRNDITPSTTQPQSLFTFLRKNVGKDLTTISMPVTSNEPITILQKIAEAFESANLLNEAALETNSHIKIIKIATFAISSLSPLRSKERNLRKPFNPILGETFEYVSDTLNFRLIGEKTQHKPSQIFAFHVDAPNWELSLTLNPDQKFWGKSVELMNKGTVSLKLKKNGEIFKWSQPSTLLKNIITGDRYTEPNNSITVSSSTGLKATVDFKKAQNGGLFSGPARTEELTIKSVDSNGKVQSDILAEGKWTDSIQITGPNIKSHQIWTASKLLASESTKWGFTEFASNLNEITELEKGLLPPTDSRFRPDVKSYEKGNVAKAESLKLEIEQIQRDERNRLSAAGLKYKPNYFKQVSDLEFEYQNGPQSYWVRRKTQNWEGISKLW